MADAKEAQDGATTDFLYDFLYVDLPRISSFYSHLENDGVPNAIKRTENEDMSSGRDNKAHLAGLLSSTSKNQKIHKTSYEETFDPSLILPITTIEKLDAEGYISRDIKRCHLGQLVLMPGSLSISDFRLMRNLWDVAIKLGIAHNIQGLSSKEKKDAASKIKKEFGDIQPFIESMPHALTAHFNCDNELLFSVLEVENLRVQPESFALSHGNNIAGKWYVLGLLDAFPEHIFQDSAPFFYENPLINAINQIAQGARELLGRPKNSYAVTPVAIFRQVKPYKELDRS